MEGGERKEEAALPPDYVSLAQLQERWLQKQEEMKLKQKREEEEKRERDARALRQKQEEEEKRERDARAQNGRNRKWNQRWGAEIGGGFVRAKEIVRGGPGDGGENNKKIGKKGRSGTKKKYFRGAAATEEKEKIGAEAEVLSGGGAGILSGEGGNGGGSSAVEEVGCVSVVEVLPRNGEIAHVNRIDLRGGLKKNARGKGSLRVNELKQSEVAIDLEKEKGGEKGVGKEWSGSGKGSEKGGEGGTERGVDRGIGSEEEGERRRGSERGRGGERWSERGGEGGSERVVDRGRGSKEEGERGGERRRGSERGGGRGRGGKRRKNGGNPERKINMLKEHRPVVSEGKEVDLKLENKTDQDEISEVCSEIASLRVEARNETRGRDNRTKEDGAEGEVSNMAKVAVEIGKKVDRRVLARKGEIKGSWTGYLAIGIRGHDNKAKEDGVEGEGSNGEIVAVEVENKVDHKVLSRKGENSGFGRGYQENGNRGRENKAKEDGVEGGGSNGEEVAVEIEKKVDHKVLSRKGENSGYGRGYRKNGIWGRENKAKEDGVEGGGSNGEEVAVEIEKKVDHNVLSRKGENSGYGRRCRENGNRRGGFGRGRSYTRPKRYDDSSMKWREVWVKKEDKMDA